MKRTTVVTLGIILALFALGAIAAQVCSTNTVFGPGGTMTNCYTCCHDFPGGGCITHCIPVISR